MKRALLTVHKFFPQHKAGTEVLTLSVAKELQRRSYEVMVVAANPPDQDARLKITEHATSQFISEYVYEGVQVRVIEEGLRLKSKGFDGEFFNAFMGQAFKDVLESFAPDVVHVFHAQNLSASIIEESLLKKIPIVVSTTDFWFVCPVVQLRRPDGGLCRGPQLAGVNCLTCYTPQLFPPQAEFEEALGTKYPGVATKIKESPKFATKILQNSLYVSYLASKAPGAIAATLTRSNTLRNFINKANAITVPTKLMKEILVENDICADLIHHIPFGIDTASLEAHQTKLNSDQLRIGYIGTLFEHKGVDLLIKAFLSLPGDAKATLTIYGDLEQFPQYGRYLQDLVKVDSPNSGKINFATTFPNHRLGEILSSMDVLVVPSRWYENTPLVMQSALATKTPLIVTDLGGMSELVKHEHNGLLFRLNDVDSLKQQLLKILNEPQLLQQFRNNIQPEKTTQQMVDQFEALYRDKCRSAEH